MDIVKNYFLLCYDLGMNNLYKNKKILLVSQNLNIEGAPLVLYNLARILLDFGFKVDILSSQNGKLFYKFKQLGINIYFAKNNKEYPYFLHKKIIKYDLIIANTIISYKIVEKLKDYVPIIWYLHESYIPDYIIKSVGDFNNICCVSDYAKEGLEKSYNKLIKEGI